METKQIYFTINEAGGDQNHIGTAVAATDEELFEKIKIACLAHFDEEVEITSLIQISECIYGRIQEVDIKMADYDTSICITETWIY